MTHPPPLRLLVWRARVPLTVLALLVCCAVAAGALRTPPEDEVPVVVARADLEAGATLAREELRTVPWPARLVPEGVAAEPADLEGRRLAVAVPAGMPLAGGVLADDARWAGAPPGSVAAPVRLADPELAGMLGAGDRLDVLVVPHEGGAATRVARDALVLAGPPRPEENAGLLGGGTAAASGLVLLAVTPAEAGALAEHAVSGAVTAVLVQ